MNPKLQMTLRLLAFVPFILLLTYLHLLVPRTIATPFLPLVVLAYGLWLVKKRIKPLWVALGLFLVTTLSPVDFHYYDITNMPTIKKVQMGLVTRQAIEINGPGYFYGGCCVSIYDSIWVVVW
jgi:hypothetical protein